MLKDKILDLAFSKFPTLEASSDYNAPRTVFRHISAPISVHIWDLHGNSRTIRVFSGGFDSMPVCLLGSFTDGQHSPLHQHDYIELAYVVSGSFSQNIGNMDYVFHENDVVIINQGVLHFDYLNANDACILFLNIPNQIFEQIFGNAETSYGNYIVELLLKRRSNYSHIHGSRKQRAVADGQDSVMARSLLEIIREICQPSPGSSQIIHGHLLRAVYHLAREYQFSLPDYSLRDMRRLLYDEVLHEIRVNCRDITIADLQRKYFYHRDYFNLLIKEQSGFTFRELRQRLRLEEAAKLLLETNMRVEDISLAVGYENQGFFYRIFTEHYGVTPRAYRMSRKR